MPKSHFSEFSPDTYQDWLDKTNADLKGKPFEDLYNHTSDGVLVKPLYAPSNLKHKITEQPLSASQGWVVVEEITVEDEKKANKLALDKLNRGANGLLFYVFDDVNVDALLEGVMMEYIHIHFVVEGTGIPVLEAWLALAIKKGVAEEKLKGSINIDPIESAARTGNWRDDVEADLDALENLVEACPPNIKCVCVNNNLFANAGASAAQQLAISLAHIHEYLVRVGMHKADQVWLNMAIGRRYFREIAKFRAMRRLWQNLLYHYAEKVTPLHIYAENGMRNKTIYDPWVNMLRTTTEGMSAAIGEVDEILLRGYDAVYKEESELANRVARNQQLILSYESYLSQVKDAGAGSYYIEELTEELAKKAWEIFKNIEAMGGLIKALEAGYVQDIIESEAKHDQRLYNEGRIALIGSNLYPNKQEKMKGEVNEPMFAAAHNEPLALRPVIPTRLAEEQEKERLANEEKPA